MCHRGRLDSSLVSVQMPEYILQAVVTAMLLLTGKWFSGLILLVVLAWNVRTYLREEHTVDVTEVFRQIPREKTIRIVKLVVYLLLFVYSIYRYNYLTALPSLQYLSSTLVHIGIDRESSVLEVRGSGLDMVAYSGAVGVRIEG